MSDRYRLPRRDILGIAAAASGLAVSGGFTAAFAQALKRTPGEILGPFYPVLKTMDRGADLTTIAGKPGRAAGQLIHVMGREMNIEGQPAKGARVELLQTHHHEPYTLPTSTDPSPLHPDISGFSL